MGVSFLEILLRRIQAAMVPTATPEARDDGARACRELATALEPPTIVHEDACKRLNKSR
jgi:hypothetical protein